MIRVQRQLRFDGAYLLAKSEESRRRIIIENGLEEQKWRIVNPPQYGRVIPAVMEKGRDSRQDCLEMLAKTRECLAKSHVPCAELMSMRCCLSSMRGMMPHNQVERFLRIYEGIVLGSHRIDGSEKNISSDDIKYLHAFYYNTILKQLQ